MISSNTERKLVAPKQIIVVNKNLNMPNGKLAAQVSHASLGALIECGKKTPTELHIDLEKDSAVEQWLTKRFTKVVLYVKNESQLIKVYNKAKEKGLPTVMITDAGFTVFDGKPTKTCVGIGPAFPKDFIGITDKLRVL
jgi:peptidyl-tRNA hydrolase, PTH2 family